MQAGLPEEVVAVLADAVEARKDALVVDAFALDVEEGALAERAAEHHGAGRARAAQQTGH